MWFQRVRCCKAVTFDNFCTISLATALEHHSANQFLRAATNLNVVQPKLFQASRQDDRRFSDCTVSVIQILDDADAAFPHPGRGIADRSIRDHHVRRQTAQPLTILPPLPHSRLGYPRSGLSRSDLVRWHFSDLLTPPTNVDYQGKSGSNSDIAKSTRCRYESLGWTCSGASSARPGGFNSAGWNHS